ncbi:MAG: CoA pyrophosphatase [Acidobacteriota bacterium]|nr:CoA pyrophosphatase [Acidobacteriota bacterium]
MPPFPSEHGDSLRRWVSERVEAFEWRRIDDPEARQAAVAVTLLPDEAGRGCFLLTRRGSGLRRHRGQWALPGGRLDEGETREEAALRELDEEVGLSLQPQSILGRLDDFATRSGWVIAPIVVWCEDYVDLVADPGEVAAMYRIPLEDIERPDLPILTDIPESDRPVLSVPIRGGRVHAPTAAFIYQFLEVALRGNDTRVADYEQPVFAWR